MGPRSPRFLDFCDVIRRFGEGVAISYDSNLIAAHVGASNGPGGMPRALTALQAEIEALGPVHAEKAREDAVAWLVGPSMMAARLAMQGCPWVQTIYHPVQRNLFDEPPAPLRSRR